MARPLTHRWVTVALGCLAFAWVGQGCSEPQAGGLAAGGDAQGTAAQVGEEGACGGSSWNAYFDFAGKRRVSLPSPLFENYAALYLATGVPMPVSTLWYNGRDYLEPSAQWKTWLRSGATGGNISGVSVRRTEGGQVLYDGTEQQIVQGSLQQSEAILPHVRQAICHGLSASECEAVVPSVTALKAHVLRVAKKDGWIFWGPGVVLGVIGEKEPNEVTATPDKPQRMGFVQRSVVQGRFYPEVGPGLGGRMRNYTAGYGFIEGATVARDLRVLHGVVLYDPLMVALVKNVDVELLGHMVFLRTLANHDATAHALGGVRGLVYGEQRKKLGFGYTKQGDSNEEFEYWSTAFHQLVWMHAIEADSGLRQLLLRRIGVIAEDLGPGLEEKLERVLRSRYERMYGLQPSVIVQDQIGDVVRSARTYWVREAIRQMIRVFGYFDAWMEGYESPLFDEGCPGPVAGFANFDRFLMELSDAVGPMLSGIVVPYPQYEARASCITRSDTLLWEGREQPLNFYPRWLLEQYAD